MILLPGLRTSVLRVLNIIILLDLIFGGSGRLIMIGSISFRTIIFGFALLCSILYHFVNEKHFETESFLLIGTFIAYLLINVIFIGNKSFSIKFDFLARYLYLLMVFFYEIYFTRYGVNKTVEEVRKILEMLTFLFAIFSILLWGFALTLRGAAYGIIELRFFRPYVYGNFDFFGPGLPRIFMKSSIFVPIGLMFELDRLSDNPSAKSVIRCMIYAVALLTTFTSGLFLATAVCTLILFYRKRLLSGRSTILIAALLLAGVAAAVRLDLLSLMMSRYTGDYTTSYRSIQMGSIIREFIQKPLLGHGFGHEFTTVYGNTMRTTSGFEIAYGETLVDTGIIGFGLYIAIIGLTLKRLLIFSRYNKTFYIFAVSLILICLESCTNPFINNSIGLTFFAICAGVANAFTKENGVLLSAQDVQRSYIKCPD